MSATWRLMIDMEPAGGAWNMALDRAIQLSRASGEAPPTLRLYGWSRPTVTIGRFQDLADVDREACAVHGVDVVRRFTGGRGVLHDDEVTYAVVASVEDGIPQGTTRSYRHLCSALVEAYVELGVDQASLTHRNRGVSASGACYLQTTSADLSLGARKLSGSAQVWTEGTVLQHGSFVLSRDLDLEAAVFALSPERRAALAGGTVTIRDAVEMAPSDEQVRRAVVAAFERTLEVTLLASGPTPEEVRAAHLLLAEVHVDG